MQKDKVKAMKYYQKAIDAVGKRSYYAYSVGDAFKKFYLLDEAIRTYELGMKDGKNPIFFCNWL